MKPKLIIPILIVLIVVGLIYWLTRPPSSLTLTGIVTTDEVIVSPEISGRLEKLHVREGDEVTNGQLLAEIQPREQQADFAFYASGLKQSSAQVAQAEADLRFQELQTSNQIRQAEANLASTESQRDQASAELENATLTYKREQDLYKTGAESVQAYDQARTTRDADQARLDSLKRQVEAAQAAVSLAEANEQQVVARRAAVTSSIEQRDAADAQRQKSAVRLDYTQVRAPISGIVDTRAALKGEVLNPAQAIVTLIDQDNLWVRVDVEETYIDRIRLNEKLRVRLPSGVIREGTVFYRGVDADFATQRDVSRTKRDIKTFEVRLRCDNKDRALEVGLTAYVLVPLKSL